MEYNELMFFDRMPQALPLYEAFIEKLDAAVPSYNLSVKKTQISFSNRYNFAFVSLPVRKMKGWPEVCIIVTFGLRDQVTDPRIAVSVEPYPNRWTHHVVVGDAAEIDGQLMAWIQEAYTFSMNK